MEEDCGGAGCGKVWWWGGGGGAVVVGEMVGWWRERERLREKERVRSERAIEKIRLQIENVIGGGGTIYIRPLGDVVNCLRRLR